MAGFAVIVRRCGEAVPLPVIEAMRDALTHRAPDGIDVTIRGNVAVVFGRLHATPEAQLERQPQECAGGGLLVADARLDNRAELMEGLGWSRPAATTTDVELLAACYAQRGVRMAEGLLGDFSVVAIDPDGRITCFRDHLGVKPLYYWISDEWVVLASELRQIAAHPDAPRDADVGMLGQYLSGWVESTTGTVVRDVHRLPAAHAMVLDGDGPRTWRYWTPPFDDRIELANHAEYQERFLELFTDAVRCRLRTAGPIGAELSGGLDSTSVTAMGVRLARAGDVAAREVLSFSCVFPWSVRADEAGYISEAVGSLDVDWTQIVDDAHRSPWVWDDAAFWSDVPLPPDGPDHVRLCRSARERGCSVVLTGHGGDHAFDPTPSVLPELLEDGRLLAAWRMAAAFAGPGLRAPVSLLMRTARSPRRGRRGAVPRAAPVVGAARAEAGLDHRPTPGRLPRTFRRKRAQQHFEQFAGGYDAMTLEILDRIAARAGVEYRHPYLDRRLVEFGCRVPVTVHAAPTLNRCLQRAGLRDVLPPGVAARRSKARFSEVWLRDIEGHLPEAEWRQTHLVRNGWIDLPSVCAAMERTRGQVAGPSGAGPIFLLWGIVQAESVLRALQARTLG